MASLHGAACRSGRGLAGGEGGEQQGRAQGLRRDVARLTEGRGAGKLHDEDHHSEGSRSIAGSWRAACAGRVGACSCEAKLAAGLRERWLYGVKAAQLI